MNKKYPIACFLSLVVLIQACVSAKIISNKDPQYAKHPKKIFLLMNGAKESKNYCVSFVRVFQLNLREKQIQSESYFHDPLSLDTDEDVNKKIDGFSPEALMIFKQTTIHSTNNSVDGGTFEITLIDGETKKPVWKSNIEVYGQFGIEDSLEKGVQKLYQKLVEDQII